MDTKIFVYIQLNSQDVLVGQLWTHFKNGKETASFEYANSWLENKQSFSLEPSLFLGKGVQHTAKKIFGALGDSAPDRWGRTLMLKNENVEARCQKRAPRTLNEIDYLLLVNDTTRQGALRFRSSLDGDFLTSSPSSSVPPLMGLSKLLTAAEHISENKETSQELRLLLAPGSSLGGARPKASIMDNDGDLCIAKFPKKNDTSNVVLWEAVALTLAKMCGINTPTWQVKKILNKPVLIIKRFDRIKKNRIGFLSAMSMLDASDNSEQNYSYLDIADSIKIHGAAPRQDLEELWRRIIFSIMISNTDDHLRNHGFLYSGVKGWRLSPIYDVNPTNDNTGILHTYITQNNNTASLEVALSVAEYFGLKQKQATTIIEEVKTAVANWRHIATKLGLPTTEIKQMENAFKMSQL